ncbi:MAG: hypothetical protein ACRD2S_06565, partial [Terriglobales bacterium]
LYIQRTFGPLAEIAREATEQPDAFWQKQSAAIRARIRSSQKSAIRATLTLASAVVLILMTALLMKTNSRVAPMTAQPDPDQQLMIAVEQAVGSDVPAALEPAALLSDEIINDSQTGSTSHPEGVHQ